MINILFSTLFNEMLAESGFENKNKETAVETLKRLKSHTSDKTLIYQEVSYIYISHNLFESKCLDIERRYLRSFTMSFIGQYQCFSRITDQTLVPDSPFPLLPFSMNLINITNKLTFI